MISFLNYNFQKVFSVPFISSVSVFLLFILISAFHARGFPLILGDCWLPIHLLETLRSLLDVQCMKVGLPPSGHHQSVIWLGCFTGKLILNTVEISRFLVLD